MDLNRTPSQKITSASQEWNWDDQSSQDRFNSLLSSSHKFQVIGDFLIGAMVINRALAFIDVRAYTRNLQIKPQVTRFPPIGRPLPLGIILGPASCVVYSSDSYPLWSRVEQLT